MNTDFPRIITLLRKEKGMSQKQAAAELGISQALLSHYEKGIRECGLDFLVRVAKYYDVSCDYLVGITSDRKGAILNIESDESNTQETGKPPCDSHCANLANLNRRLVMNSISVISIYLHKQEIRILQAKFRHILWYLFIRCSDCYIMLIHKIHKTFSL